MEQQNSPLRLKYSKEYFPANAIAGGILPSSSMMWAIWSKPNVKHLIVINTPPNCQCLPHPLQKSPLLENSPPILYLLPVKSPFPVWAQTGSRQLQAQKPKNQVLICKSRQTCTLKNTTNTPVPYQILLWTCAQSSDPQAHHAGYAPDVCWRAVITA